MRILRAYPFLPPLPGGMERHIQHLTQEQRALGCEVIVAFNQGRATGSDDIRILPWLNLRRIRPQVLRDLIFYLALLIRLLGNRPSFDIVHVHGDWSAFLFARLLTRTARPKALVASLHGVAHRRHCSGLYRMALSGYGLIYATGAQDAAYLRGQCRGAVHWQPSGIASPFFEAPENQERTIDVIAVGSFVLNKNFRLIVDIARALPDVSFTLVGDGPLRGTIEAACRQSGLANVRFTGHLDTVGVVRQLNQARIFLSTSAAEGTPTALLEAMACGLAVVTSRSNDYADLIRPGISGFVIDSFDVGEYVAHLTMLLGNGELVETISQRNRQAALQRSWPIVAGRITEWMRQAIQ